MGYVFTEIQLRRFENEISPNNVCKYKKILCKMTSWQLLRNRKKNSFVDETTCWMDEGESERDVYQF